MGENAQFVLVHGASHGAWCWYKIKCLLEAAGYKVTCLDLRGCGIDRSDPNTVLSFQDYNKPLADFFENLPQNEKVVLVGHSAGGLSLTDAIHRFAKKIHVAIYVAANMLKNGFVTEEDKDVAIPDISEFGDVQDFEYAMGTDQPPTSTKIKTQFQRKILYQLSPKEDSDLASMLLRPTPLRAFRDLVFVEGADAESVARIYIKTLHDNVLKLWQQESMIRRWQPRQVFTLESDHSPFFSTPSSLFACLLKAATSI